MKFSRRKFNSKREIFYFSLPEQTELTNTISVSLCLNLHDPASFLAFCSFSYG